MKEAISREEEAHKAMCRNCTEENRYRCKDMNDKAIKTVSKPMTEKVEETLTELEIVQMEC